MRVAIVGNGVAGHACAVRLAELGHAPLLIGPGLPHDRPPLTKRALVSGQLPLLADEGSLAGAGIEHVDGRVLWADPGGRSVRVSASGRARTLHGLDGVVLATGARAGGIAARTRGEPVDRGGLPPPARPAANDAARGRRRRRPARLRGGRDARADA